jgi:hypothetical protein
MLGGFQIQHIKQQEGTSSDAVQQGEVSSSKPTILANEVFGPLLLEVCVLVAQSKSGNLRELAYW